MRPIRIAFVVASIMALPASVLAQPLRLRRPRPKGQPRPGVDAGSSALSPVARSRQLPRRLSRRSTSDSELMANLEYLCDMIGPRLTGSPGLTKANQWTRDKFKQYGLADPHLESWTIEKAWTRGDAKGHVVVPVEQRLLLESGGWSPATKGPQRGPVVHVKAQSVDELSPYKGKLKGAWVMLSEVSVQPSPKRRERTWTERCGGECATSRGLREFRPALRKFLVAEGAAGILIDSNKEHGLVNMTTAASNFTQAVLPEAFLTTESYGLIWRLLKRGPVEIEIDMKNTFSTGPGRGLQHGRRDSPAPTKPARLSSSAVTSIAGTWAPAPRTTAPGSWRCWRPPGPSRPSESSPSGPFASSSSLARKKACTARAPTSKRTKRKCPRSPASWSTTWEPVA